MEAHSKLAEQEVLSYIQSFGFEAHSTRKVIAPKEIDIYIPELRLGIEYCGLYWHCDQNKPEKKYHFNKMKACEEQEVEKEIAKNFLEDNHIQGKTTFKKAFGLYYEDELLGLVTSNTHHRQGHGGINVLNRLVFGDGVQVVGGSSKLLKYLIQYSKEAGYDELITWSDNRWSQGNVYEKIGFKFIENLGPDYSYFNSLSETLERQSKQSNKKKNLIMKGAEGTHEGNTEYELALTLGLYRIWDCGKRRWGIELK
jgi:hypothetical protein